MKNSFDMVKRENIWRVLESRGVGEDIIENIKTSAQTPNFTLKHEMKSD